MNLIKGFIFAILAQILSFIQFQGQFKFELIKNNMWVGVLLGIPVSYLFMKSVQYFVAEYNGELWPSRLIGFGIGTVMFTILSYIFFKEPLSAKTLVCLGLSFAIVAIQIFWK